MSNPGLEEYYLMLENQIDSFTKYPSSKFEPQKAVKWKRETKQFSHFSSVRSLNLLYTVYAIENDSL